MTTFVAWLALVVSVASLAWQVAAWTRSGALLLVHIDHISQTGTFSGAYMIEISNNGRQAVTFSDVRVGFIVNESPLRWLVLPMRWGTAIGDIPPQALPVVVEPGAVINLYSERAALDTWMAWQGFNVPSEAWGRLVPQARFGSKWRGGRFHQHRRATYAEDSAEGRLGA